MTLAFNTAKSRATNYSPYFLMFARQPRIELDLLQPPTEQDISEDEFVARTMDRMNRAFKGVQKKSRKTWIIE